MGLDPQITFTQHDEDGDVLNPIGIQVMQLDLVVMEEQEEETMRRHCETTLMEVHERHHVPGGWHQELMITGQLPLMHVDPRLKEATLNKVLHARELALRAVPQSYETQRWERGFRRRQRKVSPNPNPNYTTVATVKIAGADYG
jgi:hypothetical protein